MIGRKKEVQALQTAYNSVQSEFVAVYGRRRIGKTFLINEIFGGRFAFQHAGVEKANMREQLAYFRDSLLRNGHRSCPVLHNWRTAFFELENFLESLEPGRKVVFLDEVTWMDTAKSGFLTALEHFWNGWACLRKDVLLIICGSATSWVVNEVLSARGGLYNRVTVPMPVAPFSLFECEQYVQWKGLPFDRLQIVECYMAFGGVAYYWNLLSPQMSAAQNLDALFFARNALLRKEFDRLFSSLFKRAQKYVEIVELLAGKAKGMTRDELLSAMKSPCGGEISRYLRELEECGFVLRCNLFGTIKKGAIYKVVDNLVLFHQTFLKGRSGNEEAFWTTAYEKPVVNTWRGHSFERLCFGHVRQIKQALGISGIRSDVYSWRARSDAEMQEDAQIDMLVERADRTITICEMRYAGENEYGFTKDTQEQLHRCGRIFREATGVKKAIGYALVTTVALKLNAYSGAVQSVVTLDDLFKE